MCSPVGHHEITTKQNKETNKQETTNTNQTSKRKATRTTAQNKLYRLAKSITQLTLCQVTTSEVHAATKLLDKACQKLQGIQDVSSQRVIDLKASIRQLRQLSGILDSCTISASYEVSQAKNLIAHAPHSLDRKSLMHRITGH